MRYIPLASWLLLLLAGTGSILRAEEGEGAEQRIAKAAKYLASDRLEGRGLGSEGIDEAADFLRREMADLGLRTDMVDGDAFQRFHYVREVQLGDQSHGTLVSGDERFELTVDRDFRPLAIGSGGEIELPLAFVGYGITAPEANYDDYAGIDVAGKGVIVLRHEPRQSDPESPFNGEADSEHAPFRRKIRNAIDHGAAAILFCTDSPAIDRQLQLTTRRLDAVESELKEERARYQALAKPTERQASRYARKIERLEQRKEAITARLDIDREGLLEFSGAGTAASGGTIPVLSCSRSTIDRLLAAAGKGSLADLESQIDQHLQPASFVLDDSRISARLDIERDSVEVKNVVGVLEGKGELAEETVVIGAHYDHLGYGRSGGAVGQIHNGADDNASGTVLMLELARHFAQRDEKPVRRVAFVAFTAEERGLRGSAHYVENPLFPLETTIAMLNFDMVGRLHENKLYVNGTGTTAAFTPWLSEVNGRHGFELIQTPGGKGPSDHASFCAKKIPVVHFFTGFHNEYHRPSDDFELLNVQGLARISQFAAEFAERVVSHPEPLEFVEVSGPSMPPR